MHKAAQHSSAYSRQQDTEYYTESVTDVQEVKNLGVWFGSWMLQPLLIPHVTHQSSFGSSFDGAKCTSASKLHLVTTQTQTRQIIVLPSEPLIGHDGI
jgi:hypothetical protein